MRATRPIRTAAAITVLAFLALLSTGSHTVTVGETLSQIAAQHGTSTEALARLNGLANPDLIRAGQRLVVPAATTTYTVRAGDTLGRIAAARGTSISELVELNDLANPNLIRIGQRLTVPASGGGGAPSAGAAAGVTPTRTGATHHVVQRGETISGIAARHGIPQSQLIAANGLSGVVYTGQRLSLLPAGTGGAAGPGRYTVRAGDTLSGIAQRHGTTVRALVSANGLADADRVMAGTNLTIPGGTGGGALRCPVDGPVRFMNDWGFPRSGGRFHEGTDLFAPRGTPVVAVVSGTVVQTTGRIGGLQVKLMGDDGVGYYGTHLDAFGESGRVSAGTVIGYVGSSGNAAGGPPHLHFEVHPGAGAAVNPYPLVADAC